MTPTKADREKAQEIYADLLFCGSHNSPLMRCPKCTKSLAIIAKALADQREADARIAEADDYLMIMTHDIAMNNELFAKVRKQMRKEVASAIRKSGEV